MSGEERLPFLVGRALAVNAIWWFRPARDLVNRWVRPYQGGMGGAERSSEYRGECKAKHRNRIGRRDRRIIPPLPLLPCNSDFESYVRAGLSHDPQQFRKVASARSLYHWNADANQEY